MATPHEQRRANTLRLIALSTNDPLARTVALDELGESEDQASHELSQTCWSDDMSNLRTAAEANFKSKVVPVESLENCPFNERVSASKSALAPTSNFRAHET